MSYRKKISQACVLILILNLLPSLLIGVLISSLLQFEDAFISILICIGVGIVLNLGFILFSFIATSFGSMADSLIDANENLKNINSNINKLNETKSNNQTTIVLKENKTKGWGTAEVE